MRSGPLRSSRVFFAVLIFMLGLNACGPRPQPTAQPVVEANPTPAPTLAPSQTPAPPSAEVTLSVTLLQSPPAPQNIYVDLLDEVTGLGINPDRHLMQKGQDDLHYTARVLVPAGSTVKYRYTREGKPGPVEYNCAGQQVRYRVFLVAGKDTVPDVVCGWSDQEPNPDPRGRIMGIVTDAQSGQPLPDILVSAGGASTLTASDGSYLLEDLPAGTHNLAAYSLDGAYLPYQQGAVVAANSATPGPLQLAQANMIQVEFRVTAPKEGDQGLPVRILGNLLQLGNTFSDLSGGLSTVAFRAPLLNLEKDGSYSIKLTLPAGLDLRYKYSLGDGFWNGELTLDGQFYTRQLILPDHDLVVQDVIAAWQPKGSAPVTFSVTAPANTPAGDTVSIQLSPFGWTEPLPMWPLGENRWYYILYNPQNLVRTAAYRYCRNEQCGVADNAVTAGPDAAGVPFKSSDQPQMFKDDIQQWAGMEEQEAPPAEKTLVTRKGLFWTGVETQPNYNPSWLPHYKQAFQEIHQINAGWVVLTPAWQLTTANPPVLQALPGRSARWSELAALMAQARQQQLHVALYPSLIGGLDPEQFWQQGRRDADWWDRWFTGYRAFLLNFADLAKAGQAEALIVGGDELAPMLPSGKLGDGQPSGVPRDAAARWEALIAEVRARFSGQLLWAVSYRGTGKLGALPAFTGSFDQIYLLWSAPLAAKAKATEKEQIKAINTAIKKDILPVKERFKKPVLIAAGYPSVKGALTGCVKSGDACLSFDTFNQPFVPIPGIQPDLKGQASIYRAILKAICRPDYGWISGLVVRGYYPAAAVADTSLSIRGKPSEQVLAQWFAAIQKSQK